MEKSFRHSYLLPHPRRKLENDEPGKLILVALGRAESSVVIIKLRKLHEK